MRKAAVFILSVAIGALSFVREARAQGDSGALVITARITPSGARSEPVRQFTFYILTKSYSDIVKEVEEKDPVPGRDQLLTPDDIINVPEFLLAYQRTNSGGVTNGLPKPKYTDADKTEHPEKYEKL